MADLTISDVAKNTMAQASAKTIPTNGATKQMNEDTQVEIVSDELYPWAMDNKEKRRAFIFEFYPHDASVDVKFEIEAMNRFEQWLLGQSKL